METAPLRSFAAWARTALIREVTGRVAAVLALGSPERVEQPRAVAALEKAVAAAGGGDVGRAAVAERAAYTWFNRIIALRFMDANGYTGIGVVSPQAGVEVGQPEILAEGWRYDSSISAFVGGPGRAGFEAAAWFDKHVIDGAVNGVAALVRTGGKGLRTVQNGYVRSYALWVGIGVVGLLVYFLTRVL